MASAARVLEGPEVLGPRELTLEQWADLDEDEPGELVDGRLVEEEVASFLHEMIVSWLIRTLGLWASTRGAWVFGSEAKYGLSPRRGRKPDVSVYLPGTRPPSVKASMSRKPPGLLVEVVSPRPRDARRDRVEKLGEYAKFGVRYYWLIEPELRVFEILELGAEGRYTIALSASEGAHAVPGCDGLTLDLDALWAELDALTAAREESGDEEISDEESGEGAV